MKFDVFPAFCATKTFLQLIEEMQKHELEKQVMIKTNLV